MLGRPGADVIKVEAFTGDMMRRGLPQSNGLGSAFTTMTATSVRCAQSENQVREVAQRLIEQRCGGRKFPPRRRGSIVSA